MNQFEVQSVCLNTSQKTAFTYIADPNNLPEWTYAFSSVSEGNASMQTPDGEVDIDLSVSASETEGTVDWRMRFPDGSQATAFSRVVGLDGENSIYTFLLTPPPVPLELIEGTLKTQSRILREELQNLKRILQHHE